MSLDNFSKNQKSASAAEIKDTLNEIKDTASNIAENTSDAVKDTLEKTAASIKDSAEIAKENFEKVKPDFEDLTAKAQELASKGIDFCTSCTEQAKQHFHRTSEATSRYVAEQPTKSVVIAALAGAALAAAFLSRSRRP